MKQIINEIPVKTTNSFNANSLVIDIPDNITSHFHGYEINDDQNLILETTKTRLLNQEAVKLNIKITSDNESPIIFNYYFDNQDNLIEEINIEVLDNVNANIIFHYEALNKEQHYHYLKQSIKLNKDASLNFSTINMLNNDATSIMKINTDVFNNSNLTYNLIDIGGNNKISSCYGNTYNNANNNLNVIYLGSNEDLIDTNYYYINQEPLAKCDINVQGILLDRAKKTFRGTIKFVSGAKGSVGNELENCMMLSPDASSISVPLLLCDEEDVIGGHSASSGEINKDQLFYLMSKGLTKKEATDLIIMSKINPILNNINNEKIVNDIMQVITSML